MRDEGQKKMRPAVSRMGTKSNRSQDRAGRREWARNQIEAQTELGRVLLARTQRRAAPVALVSGESSRLSGRAN
jgi:hypothetical protein